MLVFDERESGRSAAADHGHCSRRSPARIVPSSPSPGGFPPRWSEATSTRPNASSRSARDARSNPRQSRPVIGVYIPDPVANRTAGFFVTRLDHASSQTKEIRAWSNALTNRDTTSMAGADRQASPLVSHAASCPGRRARRLGRLAGGRRGNGNRTDFSGACDIRVPGFAE
jgi:hypothetical protein